MIHNLKGDMNVYKMHMEGAYCKVCGVVLKCATKYSLELHANTPKHRSNAFRSLTQTRLNDNSELLPKSVIDFEEDLVKTFLAADIPLHKLQNSHLQKLFETYAGKKVPSVYKARTTYVNKFFTERIGQLSDKLNRKKLWVILVRLFVV